MPVDLKYFFKQEGFDEVKRSFETLAAFTKEFGEAIVKNKEEYKEAARMMGSETDGISSALKSLGKDADTINMSMIEKIQAIRQHYGEFRQSLIQQGGFRELVGIALPEQLGGINTAFKSFKQSILQDVPFGGLVGLMVLGATRPEQVRAASVEAMRVFQQAGYTTMGQMTRLSGEIRQLGIDLGKGPVDAFNDLMASAQGFAAAGVDAGDVLQKSFMSPLLNINETIIKTTIRLDSFFKLSAGTTAQEAGNIMKNFALGADDAARAISGLKLMAQDAGFNVQSFMGTVLSSSAALRTQRIDITEVAEAQLKLQKAIEAGIASNISDPTARRMFAAGYAEQAVGQLTRGLAGLSVGMSAVLAERISQTRPEMVAPGTTGLGMYYALREGFGGRGQETQQAGMFTAAIQELGRMAAEEAGPDVFEQRYFLEKLVPGLGAEGSRAIVEVSRDIKGGVPIQETIKKHQEALSKAFIDRGAETSAFQRNLLNIQDGIAKIGTGLLGAVITGFKGLYWSLEWLRNSMVFGGDPNRQRMAEEMIGVLNKHSDKSINTIVSGVNQAFHGSRGMLEAVTGTSREEAAIRRRYGEADHTIGQAAVKTIKEGLTAPQMAGRLTTAFTGPIGAVLYEAGVKLLKSEEEPETKTGEVAKPTAAPPRTGRRRGLKRRETTTTKTTEEYDVDQEPAEPPD